ncbi:hypothetical protein PRIPAC_96008 [Pristionchus pacificus]|uniref:Uncharacterized protein n=1 Tax=Pristionchus pacificus TaxID=54126 RepID=A0A2A6BJU1_PRIPA|nr:hypothetical protein PRIPAC_96008 [Pristionchus pacificus]|eukprot:PDM66157.1 hypothetical protein PRIPAC_45382 [Pristionchus pacificus]
MGAIMCKPNAKRSAIADANDANPLPGSVLVYDRAAIPPQFVAADSVSGQALPEKVAKVHKDSLPTTIEKMVEVRMVLTEY